jgi:hypothetical protein
VARKVIPEIVCRDVGGMPAWFPYLVPGALAGAALGIAGGYAADTGEITSPFSPNGVFAASEQSEFMGSAAPSSPGSAVMESVPPLSVPTPPIVIETQPITVPEPSSLWLFWGPLAFLMGWRMGR